MGDKRAALRLKQAGQSMAEYTVVLAFGMLVLLKGTDILEEVLSALKSNYNGYSYAVSLSDVPDYDSLYEYGMSTPEAQQAQADLEDLMDTFSTITGAGFPTVDDFGSIVGDQLPDSPADILAGALSFF